jgi:DNA-directed RNA polymerase specialized sigma24 family protein
LRGGARQREELDDLAEDVSARSRTDLLSLHEALEDLAADYPRVAEVLELQYFGGWETAQVAKLLGVAPRTVERDAHFGRAWLHKRLSPGGPA